jgi:hypothetical protein
LTGGTSTPKRQVGTPRFTLALEPLNSCGFSLATQLRSCFPEYLSARGSTGSTVPWGGRTERALGYVPRRASATEYSGRAFEVVALLGGAKMAEAYRVKDTRLGRDFAIIKRIRPRLLRMQRSSRCSSARLG